jgi:lipid A 3-O-deacylase
LTSPMRLSMMNAVMGNFRGLIIGVVLFCELLAGIGVPMVGADDREATSIPTRYGVAASFGNTVDPVTDIAFVQLSGFAMWDYDKVWHHWAPEPLRFKVEATAGLTVSPRINGMASVGMMALYYLEFISGHRLNPYLEGGIGLIYTGFKVEGQGSHFNFHPQIGVGTDIQPDSGPPFFGAVRFSHISNGGLHHENRGVNSVVIMIGRYF